MSRWTDYAAKVMAQPPDFSLIPLTFRVGNLVKQQCVFARTCLTSASLLRVAYGEATVMTFGDERWNWNPDDLPLHTLQAQHRLLFLDRLLHLEELETKDQP